jgi:putative heme iron utilization protein
VRDLAGQVQASQQDAAAARVLAGAADRDVSGFRHDLGEFRQATVASFDALREDFVDLRSNFGALQEHVHQGFTEMRGKFDAAAAGQQQIVDLLDRMSSSSSG